MGKRVLYITYDGLSDPLGRSQVLPYVIGLARRGHQITILSCEKLEREMSDGARIRALCEAEGVEWHPIRYRQKPPVLSSAYDAMALKRAAEELHLAERFDLVHCRSYIPAMVGMHLKRRFGVPFLFDMRGFWPDEKVEGKSWNLSNPIFRAVYRYFKDLEVKFLSRADHIISLTYEGKRLLEERPEIRAASPAITVIPCCVDFKHFALAATADRHAKRRALGMPDDARVLAYLGSLGSWYMLDEMLDFFRTMLERDPSAVFLFVTCDSADVINAAARARDVPLSKLFIRGAAREEVPLLLATADLGIFFIAPLMSKKASSPTKMGEMLALGLPIVTNSGVGDVARIVEETGCGVAIDRFDAAAYAQALDDIAAMDFVPAMQRSKAMPWFDVEIGIGRYDAVYQSVDARAS